MRRFALAQIAVQLGVVLTPFYTAMVRASLDAPAEHLLLDGVARHASGLAQSRDAESYFTQQATSMATAQVQSWLQQFGTARFELSTDNKFKTNGALLDLLVPLYTNDDRLFFTQTGFRHSESQSTGNIGLGQRHFVDDWMLGYNAFYDQNLSQGHKRFGLGAEAWRDYLKLSANGYYRISDWKAEKNLTDYAARPANGFDLRAEGWLPSLPMLGGRVMYEQYYGDEVALYGINKRQKDPSAFTGGVSITPFPLMTITADRKTSSGNSDSRVGLQFTYQLGTPLHKQLDSDAVGERRTLAGSAQDLVERNNNIVLEYRKQEVIELTAPAELQGEGKNAVILPVQVNAKYPLKEMNVVGTELTDAGGKIEATSGNNFRILLPAYKNDRNNRYPLTIIAKDTRGNVSKTVTTHVVVNETLLDYGNSEIIAAVPQLITGAGPIDITVKLVDTAGGPVTGKAALMTAEVTEEPLLAKNRVNVSATKKAVITQKPVESVRGEYVFTLTPGDHEALLKIHVTVEGKPLTSFAIKQVAPDISNNIIKPEAITSNKNELVADGVDTVEWTVKVVDDKNNVVEGVSVLFVATHGELSRTEGVTDASGEVKVSLSAKTVGEAQLQASISGKDLVTSNKKVKFTPAPVLQAITDSSGGKAYIANGKSAVRYTVNVLDNQGKPFSGYEVNWKNSGVGTFSSDATTKTDENGSAFIDLTSEESGVAQVSASIFNQTVTARNINFIADVSSMNLSEIYTESGLKKVTYIPVGIVLYRVKLADKFGNGIAGYSVNWGEGAVSATTITGQDGVAEFHWASTDAGPTGEREMIVNAQLDVDSDISQEITVLSRAVVGERGRYFWTIHTDYPTTNQQQAQEFCAKDAKGVLATESDLNLFTSRHFDFKYESNNGEMTAEKYRLADGWETKSGRFSSANGDNVGEVFNQQGEHYVCVSRN